MINNINIRAPIFRALLLISNLIIFRIYASLHGAEGVAFINAITSLYSYWIIADFGLLSIVVRERAKYKSVKNNISFKEGIGRLILKCGTIVWLTSSIVIMILNSEEKLNFPLGLLLVVNFIFYITLLFSVYERQAFASDNYSSILLIQAASNILIFIIVYFLYIYQYTYLFATTILVSVIPLVSNILCYFKFAEKKIKFQKKIDRRDEGIDKFFNGGNLYYFLLTGFSIIGNSYDAYLFYSHTSTSNAASLIGVLKIITPFYSLLQSFIIHNSPIWENKIFTSSGRALLTIVAEINKMQINCVALMAPVLITLAVFGNSLCKLVLNLDINNIEILYGVCLYRLCTAYVEPLPLVLITERFIKKYVWIVGILNITLILVKWTWLEYINGNFLYLFLICGFLNIFFIGYLGKSILLKYKNS